MTFSSGGQVQRGWNATRDRYFQRYPTPQTMGRLSFTEIEVQTLGPQSALMLGRWQLQRADPIGGNFSLVWRLIDGKWLIVHDHTSTSEQPPESKK